MISLAHGKTSNMRSCAQTWRHLQGFDRVCSSTANILIGRAIRFRSGEDDPHPVRKPRRRPPPRLTGALREHAESANLCADARRSIVSKFRIDGGAGEPSGNAIPVQSPSGRPDNRQSGSCKK